MFYKMMHILQGRLYRNVHICIPLTFAMFD